MSRDEYEPPCQWEVYYSYYTHAEVEGELGSGWIDAGVYAICNGPDNTVDRSRRNCGYVQFITKNKNWSILSTEVLEHMLAHFEHARTHRRAATT
jgi:hypothetical protein